jgi:hypothetical protein
LVETDLKDDATAAAVIAAVAVAVAAMLAHLVLPGLQSNIIVENAAEIQIEH